MKTDSTLLAFFFFFVLFAFIARAEVVYDANNVTLRNGANYYLVPPDIGGEVIAGAIIKKGNSSCSLAVVQKLLHNNGWLTKIASPLRTLFITTNFPLTMSFVRVPIPCTKDPQWLVTRILGFGDAVMVGDAKEFPKPRSGWFYIKAYDSAKRHYKLVFCFKKDRCGHVGVKTDSGKNRRLIVTENKKVQPLVFKFVRQPRDVASDISMVV
ncbi:hypothetical protein QN277_000196 [Acacia crassicarpa]|uniref:Uncharacterized protein n=1 Tax=Acacia crassicarpa TaxID=499986 RepID=A0AAE1TFT6_9FABA|nr:hypothetical protein QN277_000196 [Acacia crassicarpa]